MTLVRATKSLRRAEGVPRERAVGREAMKPTVAHSRVQYGFGSEVEAEVRMMGTG